MSQPDSPFPISNDLPISRDKNNEVAARTHMLLRKRGHRLNKSQGAIYGALVDRIDYRRLSTEGNPLVCIANPALMAAARIKEGIFYVSLRELQRRNLIRIGPVWDRGFKLQDVELLDPPLLCEEPLDVPDKRVKADPIGEQMLPGMEPDSKKLESARALLQEDSKKLESARALLQEDSKKLESARALLQEDSKKLESARALLQEDSKKLESEPELRNKDSLREFDCLDSLEASLASENSEGREIILATAARGRDGKERRVDDSGVRSLCLNFPQTPVREVTRLAKIFQTQKTIGSAFAWWFSALKDPGKYVDRGGDLAGHRIKQARAESRLRGKQQRNDRAAVVATVHRAQVIEQRELEQRVNRAEAVAAEDLRTARERRSAMESAIRQAIEPLSAADLHRLAEKALAEMVPARREIFANITDRRCVAWMELIYAQLQSEAVGTK